MVIRVSIVMPLYNKASSVASSIASVLAQTFTDWELVVVDDGSTDDGVAIVAALADTRIRLVRQANAGVSAARNRGVAEARTDLIAFLDADDLWLPEFLQRIVTLQSDFPQAAWFATGYRIEQADGTGHAVRLKGLPQGFARGVLANYFEVAAQSDPPVWTSATAVTKTAFSEMGGFPTGVHSGEDLLTWARLASLYELAFDVSIQAVFQVSGIERRPDPSDQVGHALGNLYEAHPVAGLKSYLGLWYRMQSVMAMRFNLRALACRAAVKSVRFSPWNFRNWYSLGLSLLPSGFRSWLDVAARNLFGKMR